MHGASPRLLHEALLTVRDLVRLDRLCTRSLVKVVIGGGGNHPKTATVALPETAGPDGGVVMVTRHRW